MISARNDCCKPEAEQKLNEERGTLQKGMAGSQPC